MAVRCWYDPIEAVGEAIGRWLLSWFWSPLVRLLVARGGPRLGRPKPPKTSGGLARGRGERDEDRGRGDGV